MNYTTITLTHLDGRKFYTGWFNDTIHVWARVQEVIANEFTYPLDDVSLLETDEGDMVAIGYRAVANIGGW